MDSGGIGDTGGVWEIVAVELIGLVVAEGDLGREGDPWSRGGEVRRWGPGRWWRAKRRERCRSRWCGFRGGGRGADPVEEEVADDDARGGSVEEDGERSGELVGGEFEVVHLVRGDVHGGLCGRGESVDDGGPLEMEVW